MEHNSKLVPAEIQRIKEETAANTGITKERVAEMLMEAYNDAKVQSNPAVMVAAARELGKMLGHYAPETKKITHDLNAAGIKQVLESMSDHELLKLTKGKVINGESTRIENLPEVPTDKTTT